METFFKKVVEGIKENQDTIVKVAAGIVGAVIGYLATGVIIDSQNPDLIEDLEDEEELLDETEDEE